MNLEKVVAKIVLDFISMLVLEEVGWGVVLAGVVCFVHELNPF